MESTSSGYAPNTFITLANGITSFSFNDGSATWTQTDNVVSFDIQFGSTTAPDDLHSVNMHVIDSVTNNVLVISNFPSATMPNGQLEVQATGQSTVLDGRFSNSLGSQLVPEPASMAVWLLISLFLAGFGYFRFRRKM